jgi:hypothetical protein
MNLLDHWEPWRPFADLNTFQQRTNRLFRSTFPDTSQFSDTVPHRNTGVPPPQT